MKPYCKTDLAEQAEFLNRQQCVYLEKSILQKQKHHESSFLAFVRKSSWERQNTAFSPELNCNIDALRREIEDGFAGRGNLECRFMDFNLLSLLFSGCSEKEALAYCDQLSQIFDVRFCGEVKADGPVAICVFDALFASQNSRGSKKNFTMRIGVSYQQHYLIDVVSCDRQEAKKDLFLEAVDQALLHYHALSDVSHDWLHAHE